MTNNDRQLVIGKEHHEAVFVIKRISPAANYVAGLNAANTTIPAMNSTTVYVDVQITEPLLMSPFIFGSPEKNKTFMVSPI